VGDASGTISMYQLRDKNVQQEPPRSFTFFSPFIQRKDSMDTLSPNDMKKTILDYNSPVLEPEKRYSTEDDRKQSKDPKYAYGYFVNRSRYYKQCNPMFVLELIGTKQVEKDREIRDIKINKAQTIIYVLLSDGTSRYL
jgi:hypothetical protein